MTQKVIESLLTPIRSLIMKSRPAYKDYLGEETVEEKKVLVSGTFDSDSVETDVEFIEGETYLVTIDGVEQEMVAQNQNIIGVGAGFTNTQCDEIIIFYLSNTGEPRLQSGVKLLNKSISVYQGDILILSGTPTEEVSEGVLQGEVTRHDETFEAFSTDNEYIIVVDGGEPTTGYVNGSNQMFSVNGDSMYQITADNGRLYANDYRSTPATAFSIAKKVITTKKNYDIKLLPDDLLPKTAARKVDVAKVVAKVVAKADAAQSTANAAQSTANAAQSTANAAQSTANAAQSTAKSLITTATMTYTQTQTTTNLPYIRVGSSTYYKIGDLPNSFISGDSGRIIYGNSGGSVTSGFIDGTGCLACQGTVIVVTTPGTCIVQLSEISSTLYRFTASDSGVYSNGSYLNQNIKEFVLTYKTLLKTVQNGDTSVTLHSSTPNSTKRFKITVDDTGTLTATEVTET